MNKWGLTRYWKRSLGAGILWFWILFFVDLIDSIYLLQKSTKRVKHDEQTTDIIVGEVAIYLGQVFIGYTILGVIAGLVIHFFIRAWFPKEPSKKQWWMAWFGFGLTTSLWLNWLQLASMPTIQDWLPRKWLIRLQDWMSPGEVLNVALLWVAIGVLWSFLRWMGESKKQYFLALALLGTTVTGIVHFMQYPTAPTPTKNKGTNVIIIGIDGLRPDHLKRNGYFRETAPNIEALMDESVVFSDAYSVFARTYPSWMSILTGQLPINNGIRDNIIADLIPKSKTLSQGFQENGWFTSFVTDDSRFSFMQEDLGFSRIFQPEVGAKNFALSATEPRFRMFHLFMHNPLGYKLAPVIAHNQALGKSYKPELFFEANIEELQKASEHERFFFSTHACFLHAPGDRNYPWNQLFEQKGYTRYNRLRYSRSGTKLVFSEGSSDAPVNVIAKQDAKIYDAGIAMADALVERIVGELKESGLYDNSIIILLSDHGENLWADDLPYKWHGPNHGFHPYGNGQHQVTLAIRFPDGQFAGKEVSDTVRLIDLAPTLVEYFQLDWDNSFDGKSLFPLMRGEKEEQLREVYIETGMSEQNYWPEGHRVYSYKRIAERYWIRPDNHWVMVRDEFLPELLSGKDRIMQMGDWKLTWRPMEEAEPIIQLFNHKEDPENRLDVSFQNPVRTAYLGMKLWPYLERDDEEFSALVEWKELTQQEEEPVWREAN